MRFFEDSNPLKHAGHTETLLFVAPDRPTFYLPIWPAYAYTFLVGLFNTAVPPTEIMSHPLIYLCIYNLPNTLKTKIQRFRSYTLSNKNPSAWNFLSPEPEVMCGTVAIIIPVVLLSPYLRIRGVSLSSIHYNQSHRVYIVLTEDNNTFA